MASKDIAEDDKEVLKKLGYSYKKTFIHPPKRYNGLRKEFIKRLESIDKEKIVYLDESGIEDNAASINGWSLKGERCFGKRSYQHKRRISMIADLCNRQVIAPLIFEGTCDTCLFETYVKELKPGQVVVMKINILHKKPKIKELIRSVRISI